MAVFVQPIAKVQWRQGILRLLVAENLYYRYQISFVLAHIQTSCGTISYYMSNLTILMDIIGICNDAYINSMWELWQMVIFTIWFSVFNSFKAIVTLEDLECRTQIIWTTFMVLLFFLQTWHYKSLSTFIVWKRHVRTIGFVLFLGLTISLRAAVLSAIHSNLTDLLCLIACI